MSFISLSLSLSYLSLYPFFFNNNTSNTYTKKWSTNLTYNQSIRRHYVGYDGILFSACLVIGPYGESVLDITAVAATVQGNRDD